MSDASPSPEDSPLILEVKRYVDAHGCQVIARVEEVSDLALLVAGKTPHREFETPIHVGPEALPISVRIPATSVQEAFAFIRGPDFDALAKATAERAMARMRAARTRESLADTSVLPPGRLHG